MGKFYDRFKKVAEDVDGIANRTYEKKNKAKKFNSRIKQKTTESISANIYDGIEDNLDEFDNQNQDEGFNDYDDDYDDNYGVGITPAQKPESFHHFILENQYKDLEKSIRGYKDVYNKNTREWETKRKDMHCFTDEEAEEILRTAQSLLATDIKLGFINKEVFGIRMMLLYKRIKQLFREIAEYRYGRYSHDANGNHKPGGYAIEQSMKLQNLKIFVELTERIVANYSRSIQGVENKLTHNSVKGQESLQNSERISDRNRGLV